MPIIFVKSEIDVTMFQFAERVTQNLLEEIIRGPGIIQQMCNKRCQQQTSTKRKQFPTVINRIKMIKL